MRFVQRINGKIVGDSTHPNKLTDQYAVDESSEEWSEYMSAQKPKRISLDFTLSDEEKIKLLEFYALNNIITAERVAQLRIK
jgi:hypothetical protein